MRRFLDLEDLGDADIAKLLELAQHLQREPLNQALAGCVVGLLFMNPSLRTLASFQAGAAQLGGSSFVITPGSGGAGAQSTWALETELGAVMDGDKAEHIREAIPVLAQYCDALGIRCFGERNSLEDDLAEPVLSHVESLFPKPLINMESAMNHPCQALADWKTLDDCEISESGRFVLSWAWHPRALPLAVPSAVVTMAARRGMHVTIARPEGYELPAPVMERARRVAKRSGGSINECDQVADAMRGANVLYAKSWGSIHDYTHVVSEARRRTPLRDWRVGESWFEAAARDAVFMHCLPVRRNVVVDDAVIDGPRSRVIQQAGNRLHVQKAVMMALLSEPTSN